MSQQENLEVVRNVTRRSDAAIWRAFSLFWIRRCRGVHQVRRISQPPACDAALRQSVSSLVCC
jgi:hypothetical protein